MFPLSLLLMVSESVGAEFWLFIQWERMGHSTVATTLDIYSHVVSGLQEAAARRFEEGLESALTEAQVAEVLEKNVGKIALGGGFEVEFISRRGVRVVDGAALEKRSPRSVERGFESHPLRQKEVSEMSSGCESCKIHSYAERKPNSLLSKIWRWHTKWCPGWKAYQAELARQQRE